MPAAAGAGAVAAADGAGAGMFPTACEFVAFVVVAGWFFSVSLVPPEKANRPTKRRTSIAAMIMRMVRVFIRLGYVGNVVPV
jgi:hypothetical protein